jgi:hypothetical protein
MSEHKVGEPSKASRKRKTSDTTMFRGQGHHPLGVSSQFGYCSTDIGHNQAAVTAPLQPPKKSIKKRKTKEPSEPQPAPIPRFARDYTPSGDELEDINGSERDLRPECEIGSRGPGTGSKFQEIYQKLQVRRELSKDGSEAEGSVNGSNSKKNKRNRVHFSCVEVSLSRAGNVIVC